MLISGGHAIMLRVSAPKTMVDLVAQWCLERPGRTPSLEHHVTLIFIGRHLDSACHEAMDVAGESLYRALQGFPMTLVGFGAWRRMGANNVLTEPVFPDPLVPLRSDMQSRLPFAKSEYGFKPHVTYAQAESNFPYPMGGLVDSQYKVTGVVVKKGSGGKPGAESRVYAL